MATNILNFHYKKRASRYLQPFQIFSSSNTGLNFTKTLDNFQRSWSRSIKLSMVLHRLCKILTPRSQLTMDYPESELENAIFIRRTCMRNSACSLRGNHVTVEKNLFMPLPYYIRQRFLIFRVWKMKVSLQKRRPSDLFNQYLPL